MKERKSLKKKGKKREKKKLCSEQTQILAGLLVEQKTGGFVVLSTPLIELPIQKTLKNAKN